MFNSFKAITAGISFIVVATILMQLLYILLVVAYNHASSDLIFLKEIQWIFKYLLGVPAFMSIMFFGGYITTIIAKSNLIASTINSIIVGLVVITSMMWSALANSELTIIGTMVAVTVFIMIIIGALFASKKLSR